MNKHKGAHRYSLDQKVKASLLDDTCRALSWWALSSGAVVVLASDHDRIVAEKDREIKRLEKMVEEYRRDAALGRIGVAVGAVVDEIAERLRR